MTGNSNKLAVFAITGMHRSGTSLTASLLQRLGVGMGEKLVGPDAGNVLGHFENIDFVEFHKGVLRTHKIDQLGSTLENNIDVPPEYLKQAKNLINHNHNHYQMWGWKDPRTTLFLNFWEALLPEAIFIFIYRSPWEVIDSLYRRGTDPTLINHPETALKMWIHYNQQVLTFAQKFPQKSLIASVYTVGQNSTTFIQAINQKFNLNLGNPPLDNFAETLLVNDILTTHRPQLIEKYFPEAIEVYQELTAQALNPRDDPSVINTPSSNMWIFKDWVKIRQLEKNEKNLKIELEEWQDQFYEAQDKVQYLETELGETQLQLDGSKAQFQAALAKLELIETELGNTQARLYSMDIKIKEVPLRLARYFLKLWRIAFNKELTEDKPRESELKR